MHKPCVAASTPSLLGIAALSPTYGLSPYVTGFVGWAERSDAQHPTRKSGMKPVGKGHMIPASIRRSG
jgi:hypothetical protein